MGKIVKGRMRKKGERVSHTIFQQSQTKTIDREVRGERS